MYIYQRMSSVKSFNRNNLSNFKSYITILLVILSDCANVSENISDSLIFEKNKGQSLKQNLLQAPVLDIDSNASPVFHPILTEENYDALLKMVDLSYAVVNQFGYLLHQSYPTQSEIGLIEERIKNISQSLSEHGWSTYRSISGRTGRDNVDPDISCVASAHSKSRLIIVSFHGSRSGDNNPIFNNGKGDWGSNYDSAPATASFLGMPEFPSSVQIHRGFGNNLSSARVELLDYLKSEIQKLGIGAPTWIWVTGHSRGGAIGSLAAGLIKSYLNSQSLNFSNVHVGGILLSPPRAYYGDPSENWLDELVDRSNLFRINVHGDLAPVSPSRNEGYRSVGVLFLDAIQAVNLRNREHYGVAWSSWLDPSEWGNFHYLSEGRGTGLGFDPNVVMRYSELSKGFEDGRLHLRSKY